MIGAIVVSAAALPALINWIGVARGSRRLIYVFKPLTIAVLMAGAAATYSEADRGQWFFTLVALAFSMGGDVALMLPGDRLLAGLGSFLVAHVFYIAAFTATGATADVPWPALPAVILASGAFLALLARALRGSHRLRLILPVTIYMAAISVMVLAAASAWGDFPPWAARAALAGAVLFALSDGLNGWRRFVRERRWMPVAVMVTYHLGQAGLVLSLLRETVA